MLSFYRRPPQQRSPWSEKLRTHGRQSTRGGAKKLHVTGRFDLVRLLLSSPAPVKNARHDVPSMICA